MANARVRFLLLSLFSKLAGAGTSCPTLARWTMMLLMVKGVSLQMMLSFCLTKPVWQNYRPLCFDAEKSNTSSIQKVSWGSHFKNGTRNGSKSLFKVSNCLFWSEEVLTSKTFFRISGQTGSRKPGASILGKSLGQEESINTSSKEIGPANLSIRPWHYSYWLKINPSKG